MKRLTKDPWWALPVTLTAVCLAYGLVFGPVFLHRPAGLPAAENNTLNAKEVVWRVMLPVINGCSQ